jgi:TonB-linked SusC/RagA family outer membrane protein
MIRKFNLLLLISACLAITTAHAQSIKVTGKVTDSADESPLIGVNIVEADNPGSGTVTDFDGFYSLEVPANTVLVFSYVGYVDKEVETGNADMVLDVALDLDSEVLDELVVVGYSVKRKSEINYAVSTVSSEEIGLTQSLRVEQALQGRSSGVQITQSSGSPGNGLSVIVRGAGTPLNSDPLYIVDGIWVDGIDYLNPSDIESISVLKDAASVAIYGASGANGVVIITTKEGKLDSKAKISLDAYYGVQTVAKTLDLLNGEEYATLLLEADPNNGFDLNDPSTYGEGTDWQAELFENAPIQSYQANITGGGAKTTYGVSGGYFNQEGIIGKQKSEFDRWNAQFKSTTQANDWFSFQANANFTHFERNALPENNEFASPVAFALNIDPLTAPYKEDGTFNFSKIVTGDTKNPLNRVATSFDTWKSDRIIGLFAPQIEFIEGLKLKTSASIDLNYANQFIFGPEYNLDTTGVYVHERVDQNFVGKNNYRWFNVLWENLLSYDKKFRDAHNLSLLAGTSYRDRNFSQIGVGLADLPTNDPDEAFIVAQNITEDNKDTKNIFEVRSESTLLSYFGRASYDYLGKYFFSFSFRRDGSSRFGENNKFANFPALSAGWIVTKDFTLAKNWNYLKARFSWGQNGNEASLGDYGFTTIVDPVRYTFGDDQTITTGGAPTVPPNNDLKWEVSTQTNVGLDMGFFNDKLTVTTDYFHKKTSDLLIPATIPSTAGSGIDDVSPPFRNVGSMKNQGWEVAIGYKITTPKDFKFSVDLNGTYIKNEVTDLGEATSPFSSGYNQGLGGTTTRMEVGKPLGYFYGYQTDGIFQNIFEVEEYVDDEGNQIQPNAKPGDFRFADLNGDGKLTDADQTDLGNPYPDFFFGLSASFEWNGLDLNLFFNGSIGNEIVNATTRYDIRVSNLTSNRLDRWNENNPSNVEPRVSLTDRNGNFRFSDYMVENGSYFKLKTLQVGYTLPKDITEKFFVQRLRFYFSVQNVFTVTGYSGLDPEIGKQNAFDNSISANLNYGVDRGLYPQARQFIGGINIDF